MTDFRKKVLAKRIRRRARRDQIISALSMAGGACAGYMILLVLCA